MTKATMRKVDMNKLLLIDDDVALTELLSEYLMQQAFDVACCNVPEQGLARLKDEHFEVLLLDVMMPHMDGFELLRQLRQFSNIPVIMLTAKGDDYDKILGLELGADDYLAKPFNQRELVARIKALVRRLQMADTHNKHRQYQLDGLNIDEASQEVSVNGEALVMTGTEFLILLHLCAHAGTLVSKEELSEAILQRKLAPFDRSLDMHVSNIRKKLADKGIKDIIKTVRAKGYMIKAGS